MTSFDPTQVLLVTPDKRYLSDLLNGIVHIHAHCILHDGQLATFLPPLSHEKLVRYWQTALRQVSAGERHIIVKLRKVSERTIAEDDYSVAPVIYSTNGPEHISAPILKLNDETWEVAGVVSLSMPPSETGPMRGLVEKLFTSPMHRRKGVARTIMGELERVAKTEGRWNLLLDTTVGHDAENVYPRLGYEKVGLVKKYGIQPETTNPKHAGKEGRGLPYRPGELVDEVWFAKDLRST